MKLLIPSNMDDRPPKVGPQQNSEAIATSRRRTTPPGEPGEKLGLLDWPKTAGSPAGHSIFVEIGWLVYFLCEIGWLVGLLYEFHHFMLL